MPGVRIMVNNHRFGDCLKIMKIWVSIYAPQMQLVLEITWCHTEIENVIFFLFWNLCSLFWVELGLLQHILWNYIRNPIKKCVFIYKNTQNILAILIVYKHKTHNLRKCYCLLRKDCFLQSYGDRVLKKSKLEPLLNWNTQ